LHVKIIIFTEQNRSWRSGDMAGHSRFVPKVGTELREKLQVSNIVEEITAYRKD
jgi:hypothetical protein